MKNGGAEGQPSENHDGCVHQQKEYRVNRTQHRRTNGEFNTEDKYLLIFLEQKQTHIANTGI